MLLSQGPAAKVKLAQSSYNLTCKAKTPKHFTDIRGKSALFTLSSKLSLVAKKLD